MGGFCSLQFAEKLQAENIPVSLIVTIDPAHLMPKLPMNVERYMNIFLARDVLGGGDVVPEKGYPGHFASYDLSKLKGILHINIDKMDIIHTQLLSKILQIPETPARLEGEGVPIRYIVPPDAAVDLWDSGMPAVVRAGDTLENACDQLPRAALGAHADQPDSGGGRARGEPARHRPAPPHSARCGRRPVAVQTISAGRGLGLNSMRNAADPP